MTTAPYTAENWPVAAAMLPFGSTDSRGGPIHDAEAEEWARHLRLVRRIGFTEVDPTDTWVRVADRHLVLEQLGGEVQSLEVSAKTRQNLDTLEEARAAAAIGEVPIGAVVVYEPIDRGTRRPVAEPRVIARAHNLRETTRDPAGHAEFLAMKEAARVLDAWRLSDCTVYVTLEPCIMCAGLMHQARIARCVYGAPDQKAGALGTLYAINSDERLNHQFAVTAGVMQDECAELLRRFFAERRKKK